MNCFFTDAKVLGTMHCDLNLIFTLKCGSEGEKRSPNPSTLLRHQVSHLKNQWGMDKVLWSSPITTVGQINEECFTKSENNDRK